MVKKIHNWASILMLSFLSACSTQTWMGTQDWQDGLTQKHYFDSAGRLAVKVKDKGSYANFDWISQGDVQNINVNTPLGNTVGQLCQDTQGVIATNSNGEQFTASSAEELSQQLMGFSVPLAHLDQWAAGYWVHNQPHKLNADGSLMQMGWTIRRQLTADGTSPKELLLSNDNLTIRLLFTMFEPTDDQQLQQCDGRGGE